jgi:hypothetical protein
MDSTRSARHRLNRDVEIERCPRLNRTRCHLTLKDLLSAPGWAQGRRPRRVVKGQ